MREYRRTGYISSAYLRRDCRVIWEGGGGGGGGGGGAGRVARKSEILHDKPIVYTRKISLSNFVCPCERISNLIFEKSPLNRIFACVNGLTFFFCLDKLSLICSPA